jgi:hypothetical protein
MTDPVLGVIMIAGGVLTMIAGILIFWIMRKLKK